MLIYKFKIFFDGNDDFLREIEIKPGQSFADFHQLLMQCISLTPGAMASFFICDGKWRRQQEIALVEMQNHNPQEGNNPKKLMEKTFLKECINSPNEKWMYIYDYEKMYTFYIELFKIYNCDDKIIYPRCVKSVADVPKTLKPILSDAEYSELDTDLADEFGNEFDESAIEEEDSSLFGDIYEEPGQSDSD